MPELPEVETIVGQLQQRVKGKKVIKFDNLDPIVDKMIAKLVPFKIKDVYRRAKSIIMELDSDNFLLIHLRMTGHFHYINKDKTLGDYEKFVVAKFHLEDGSLLTHNSIRKFGSIKLLDKEKLTTELEKLGVEPLSKEFTLAKFNEILLKKKNSNIKTLLMDQSLIAGIGNIYAQEVLYPSKISPLRKVVSLNAKEIKSLHSEIVRILKLAVKSHGTTVENYVHIDGSGGFQKYLMVYGREKCPKGHKIKKINLGGRGTSYCDVCQR